MYKTFKSIICFFIVLIISIFSFNEVKALNYKKITLYNGLEFYVFKNNNPIINYITWVDVGGIDECMGKQGIAHFVEHMMFKDNKKYTGEEFTKALQSTGGSYNAFTDYDSTVYYNTIPYYYLPLIMKLESSRINGLLFKEKQFIEERKVILEERGLRIDNSPIFKYLEVLNYYALPNSNYGRSLIGSINNINHITLQDLKNFYKSYYVPNNIKIFIIGNVSFKEVKRLAFKYYNNIPKGKKIIRSYNTSKDINSTYNTNISIKDKSVIHPIWGLSFKAPSLKNTSEYQDILALMLLRKYLVSKTSNFYIKLVEDMQLVREVSILYNPLTHLDKCFLFLFIPKDNHSYNTVMQKVDLLLNDIAKNGIPKQDLDILYNQFKNNLIYASDSDYSFLMLFANLIMLGISSDKVVQLMQNKNIFESLNYDYINSYISCFLKKNKIYLEINH